MAAHWWKAAPEGVNLMTFGFVHGVDGTSPSFYTISGLGLMTHGFVWRLNDIWVNWDDIYVQNVTWTACDCSAACD